MGGCRPDDGSYGQPSTRYSLPAFVPMVFRFLLRNGIGFALSGRSSELSAEVNRRVRVKGGKGLKVINPRRSNASENLRGGGKECKVIRAVYHLHQSRTALALLT